MRIDVFTNFPAVVQGPLSGSLLGRAIGAGLLDVRVHDLRDWTTDRHRTVDDEAFGGSLCTSSGHSSSTSSRISSETSGRLSVSSRNLCSRSKSSCSMMWSEIIRGA